MKMQVFFKDLVFSTRNRLQLVDVTAEVEGAVRESGVRDGLCLVYAPHATAVIIVNEHENGLMTDLVEKIRMDFPRDERWKHNRIDDNAAAHLASAFIASSRVFPVRNGRLIRGTWQNIFLVELDGPRSRRGVVVEVLG